MESLPIECIIVIIIVSMRQMIKALNDNPAVNRQQDSSNFQLESLQKHRLQLGDAGMPLYNPSERGIQFMQHALGMVQNTSQSQQ